MVAVPEEIVRLSEAHLNFAIDLYKEASRTSPNYVFCPTAVCSCLTLLGSGAKDDTAAQVARALKLFSTDTTNEVHEVSKKLLGSLTYEYPDRTNVDMVIANSFYLPEGISASDEFRSTLEDKYRVLIQNADFKNKKDEVVNNMNAWVTKQTKNQIKNVVNPSMFDEYTSLVLLNAVYMKGVWERKFSRESTNTTTFHLLDGSTRQVDMMYQDGKFRHGYSDIMKCRVLQMFYIGREFSMVIILPDDANAFGRLEETLTAGKIEELLNSMGRKSSIMVWLPRFQVEASTPLHSLLPKFGVADMFSSVKANLSSIAADQKLVVTNMLHKTAFAVDEEGSEGSSADMTTIAIMTSLEIGPEFHADRPFLYLIRHNNTRSVIFIGRLTEPPATQQR